MAATIKIIFYDVPSTFSKGTWSPNAWKTRFCLNFKGLPYTTEWVDYPDIEDHCKSLNILPTGKKSDGSPYYTLPAIHDPSTGMYLSDSLLIAQYLDKTYPETPTLFPSKTLGLQSAFPDALLGKLGSLWGFMLPAQCDMLTPRGREYFLRVWETDFGCGLEDVIPKGEKRELEWARLKEGLEDVDAWYPGTEVLFLIGDVVSWADVVVGSYINWMRAVWDEDSKEWKDISMWNEGRWGRLLGALGKYQNVT